MLGEWGHAATLVDTTLHFSEDYPSKYSSGRPNRLDRLGSYLNGKKGVVYSEIRIPVQHLLA